ncbi:hypothetical protein [Planctomicrobium piriforme]|uniref:hypothetical protein n=1 Tax=Planctomicrobium piriforme TaxID=1576369 RepID=UPI001C31E0FE|nr:hypothetical protein [Planctomicrobium piriforme]
MDANSLILRYLLTAAMHFVVCSQLALAHDEFERPPINYSASKPENPVSRLQAEIDRGDIVLRHDPHFGYLPDLLKKLSIPVESQMLVYSKTSLQRTQISPRTPRALYFNDQVYVGYCHTGEVLEISTADPQLGTVFYTLEQSNEEPPRVIRQMDRCLQCHGTTNTQNVPGHTIRSLYVDAGGMPILGEGTRRVDPSTPIDKRWGGWYVTGMHGEQTHLGNQVIRDRDAPHPWNNDEGQNVPDLTGRFKTSNYLTPYSDIVALLVFEHQTHVHNLLTKANFTGREALHYQEEFNRVLNEPPDHRLESTTRRIENASEKLVEGLLSVDEAPLGSPITGTSGYAEVFSKQGPRDSKGRSLRDFDLKTRVFKYPCSYLIYSPGFDALPDQVRDEVARKLRDVLDGNGGERYAHLSPEDRTAIWEILTETKPDLFQRVPAQ